MKVPKKIQRYCRYCRKKTEQTINIVHTGKRSALKNGQRRSARMTAGHGDAGRYSRKPIKSWGRNSKVLAAKDANLECSVCKKKSVIKGGFKAKAFEIVK